jgi:hypothetical protein
LRRSPPATPYRTAAKIAGNIYAKASVTLAVKPAIKYQSNGNLSDLTKNSIMEEIDALYDREQELI